MHGVGETLSGLSDFVGSELVAIDDLENIVYFRFSTTAQGKLEIGVESEWIVHDSAGLVVAYGQPRPMTAVAQLPLGSVVVAVETQLAKAILLRFASGHTIQIIDNSDHYESFSIPHAGVNV